MISIQEEEGHHRSPLAPEMEEFFSDSGLLSRFPDFEYRAEQQQMAVAVARALDHAEPLVVEAGTGVGKSLAYLVPAVLEAMREGKKAVISTHTINLQEQLYDKDIPLVRKVLGENFTAALLKGRHNYLCPLRLKSAMKQSGDLFNKSENEELRAIWDWSQETEDGTRSDLDFSPSPSVWAQVCSESQICTVKTCGQGGHCYFQEARKRAGEAKVIIVNHTLFFSLIDPENVEEGFILPNDFVIFDEAHTLEQVAAMQLGLRVSHSSLRFDLQRLYNPRSRKGLLKTAQATAAIQAVECALSEADTFFDSIELTTQQNPQKQRYPNQPPERERRIREPDFIPNTLASPLREVWEEVENCAEGMENETSRNEFMDKARRVREAHGAINAFLTQQDDDSVYWIEKSGMGANQSWTLQAAPVEVSERLRPLLFSSQIKRSVIMTSATLSVADADLSYFRNRVGAEQVEAHKIGSPFDYEKQMELFIVKSMPDPGTKNYDQELARWVEHFTEKSEGRAFVLFTSYRVLRAVADLTRPFFQKRGWRLLVQGDGTTRKKMVETFREDTNSVLFGTDSFWAGVDVPGEALSNVMVTRLPFAVPDHPLTAARMEAIEARGGHPFMEFSLPEAILKLRQGVGRLIRSSNDKGIVVLLDNRVVTKRYGSRFLSALPRTKREIL